MAFFWQREMWALTSFAFNKKRDGKEALLKKTNQPDQLIVSKTKNGLFIEKDSMDKPFFIN